MSAETVVASADWRVDSSEWKVVFDEDGVEICTRDVPGKTIREVRARLILELPAQRVWKTVLDVGHYAEFMPYITESRVLELTENHSDLIYQRLAPPVVSNRDVVLELTTEVDERLGIFKESWVSVPNRGPDKIDGVVRLDEIRGQWIVERLTEDQTRLTYLAFIEPGGAVPRWMANRANRKSARHGLLAIARRAAQ